MVVLREALESAIGDPQPVRLQPRRRRSLQPRRRRSMADAQFYEDQMKPEARINEMRRREQFINEPVSGSYIAANLQAQAQKQAPELQPGDRFRMPDQSISEPGWAQGFEGQLESIVNQARQARMAEQARQAYQRQQDLMDLLSQQPPAPNPVSYQYQGPQTGRGGYVPTSAPSGGQVQNLVKRMAAQRGWTGREWDALYDLINRESGWNPSAANPTSSARGLFQKMTSMHGPLEPTVAGQAQWGLNYIAQRYGSPSAALRHWLARVPIDGKDVGHWY